MNRLDWFISVIHQPSPDIDDKEFSFRVITVLTTAPTLCQSIYKLLVSMAILFDCQKSHIFVEICQF